VTGTAGSPAAGVREARPASGRTRTFTIKLPAGIQILSLNDRAHWAARNRHGQVIRDAAIIMTRKAKVPHLERVTITAEYRPPDRRYRDADNISAGVKYAIDGIVAAGVLKGDDKRYVARVSCEIGEPVPRGQLVLRVTEVTDETTAGVA
jgi:hypothetical protein